jgi:hypothetical protein
MELKVKTAWELWMRNFGRGWFPLATLREVIVAGLVLDV